MNRYRYTQTWFLNSEIYRHITNYFDTSSEIHVLEIGSFEGLSSVFFADTLIRHTSSTLTCVDPFLHIENNDHQNLLHNVEANFDYNISNCDNASKVTIHKCTSDDFFHHINTKVYDCIYIDGSHQTEVIIRDMENSFRNLKRRGIMWMDDYMGGNDGTIKNTMDGFLEKYNGQYEVIHCGYQLGIRKL
jgi:predicted O-methyltransferase YrrM